MSTHKKKPIQNSLFSLTLIILFLSVPSLGQTQLNGSGSNGGLGFPPIISVPSSTATTACGNGKREAGESCDDGNKINGDGCQADCTPGCIDKTYKPQDIKCGVGLCETVARTSCVGGIETMPACTPKPAGKEICDKGGLDEDCDGAINNGCECLNGDAKSCYSGAAGTEGVGSCHAGQQACVAGKWSACQGEVLPSRNDACKEVVAEAPATPLRKTTTAVTEPEVVETVSNRGTTTPESTTSLRTTATTTAAAPEVMETTSSRGIITPAPTTALRTTATTPTTEPEVMETTSSRGTTTPESTTPLRTTATTTTAAPEVMETTSNRGTTTPESTTSLRTTATTTTATPEVMETTSSRGIITPAPAATLRTTETTPTTEPEVVETTSNRGVITPEPTTPLRTTATTTTDPEASLATPSFARELTGTSPPPACSLEICDDRIDNDCDGLVDAQDQDCHLGSPEETCRNDASFHDFVCVAKKTRSPDQACLQCRDEVGDLVLEMTGAGCNELVDFSAGSKYVYFASADKVHVFRPETLIMRELRNFNFRGIHTIQAAPNQNLIVADQQGITLIDTAQDKAVAVLKGADIRVLSNVENESLYYAQDGGLYSLNLTSFFHESRSNESISRLIVSLGDFNPSSMVFDRGILYMTDSQKSELRAFDTATRRQMGVWTLGKDPATSAENPGAAPVAPPASIQVRHTMDDVLFTAGDNYLRHVFSSSLKGTGTGSALSLLRENAQTPNGMTNTNPIKFMRVARDVCHPDEPIRLSMEGSPNTSGETQTEICDGIDNNGDGVIDEGFDKDGDGQTSCALDCNDSDPAINEKATELCDGIDNNCDGTKDEGCDCVNGDIRECGSDVGECRLGTQICDAGQWSACEEAQAPIAEKCDGLDNNCDGEIDEGLSCGGALTGTSNGNPVTIPVLKPEHVSGIENFGVDIPMGTGAPEVETTSETACTQSNNVVTKLTVNEAIALKEGTYLQLYGSDPLIVGADGNFASKCVTSKVVGSYAMGGGCSLNPVANHASWAPFFLMVAAIFGLRTVQSRR